MARKFLITFYRELVRDNGSGYSCTECHSEPEMEAETIDEVLAYALRLPIAREYESLGIMEEAALRKMMQPRDESM